MTVWSIQEESPGSSHGIKIKRTLQSENERNHISVMETEDFGRILTSGDSILLSDSLEDPYHEMLALLPLWCSPSTKSVLLVGGSDGGTLGMLVREPRVEKITIVGADADVLESVKNWFPINATGFTDRRVKLEVRDGTDYVRDSRERFDLIIVDIPGASVSPLYPQSFFCDCFRLLSSDGAIITDCGSHAFLQGRRELGSAISKLKRLFPVFRLYGTPGVLPGLSHRLIAFATKTFDPVANTAKKDSPSALRTNY
ncbi:MAG: hypothetical protein Q8O19_03380, partial [Rectinemataceae bacterium]|nr:hypothetical protein [Rectinemataceae bacterium]